MGAAFAILAPWIVRRGKGTADPAGQGKDTKLSCSFCGKSQIEVARLISGPSVFICNECVELCMEIVLPLWEKVASRSDDG